MSETFTERNFVVLLMVVYLTILLMLTVINWLSKKSNRDKFGKVLDVLAAVGMSIGKVVDAFTSIGSSPKYPMTPVSRPSEFVPTPPNVGSSAVVVRNVCLRHGCSLIADSAFPNRMVCPQCENEAALPNHTEIVQALIDSRESRHTVPDGQGEVQVFMTQEQYRDYMRRPSDRDLEVARHIQQEMMTTAVPNTGSWGITSREVNLNPKVMTHKELLDAFTVKGEPQPKEPSPEEKFQQALKGRLLPWMRIEGDSIVCNNCGSRRVLLYIMIPETLTSIKAFADLHQLCKPLRSEREFEIAEG